MAGIIAAGRALPAFSSTVSGRRLVVGSGPSVNLIDLGAGSTIRTKVGFRPHSFMPAPQKGRIWAIERWDYAKAEGIAEAFSLAEIDTSDGRVIRQLKAPEGSGYFGHAIFPADGKTMFISRFDFEKGIGHLTGYDLDEWKVVADYEMQAGAIHECRLLPDGTVLAACSGVRPIKGKSHLDGKRVENGALIHFDIQKGKMLGKQTVQDNGQVVGHCHVTDDGHVFLLSRPRPGNPENGQIYFSPDLETPLKRIDQLMTHGVGPGECLSMAIDNANHRAIVTNPGNDILILLDTATGTWLSRVENAARGIVFDPETNKFIATGNGITALTEDVTKLKEAESEIMAQFGQGPFDSPHSLLI